MRTPVIPAPSWVRRLCGRRGLYKQHLDPASRPGGRFRCMTWTLAPVDSVEVTILVDYVSDALLVPAPIAVRPRLSLDCDRDQPLAEHGYSVLVSVEMAGSGGQSPHLTRLTLRLGPGGRGFESRLSDQTPFHLL